MMVSMTVSAALPIPGTANFRDLGGYPAAAGRTRTGVIYRSDGLAHLGAAGRAALQELGVATVIDLRDDAERTALPDDIEGLGLTTFHHSVFEGSLREQAGHDASFEQMYRSILLEHGGVIRDVLREVSAPTAAPSVVHCTAGKDRTGVICAIALLAVGVDADVALDDYAATEANLSGPWVEKMSAAAASHGIALTPQLLVLMSASPREAMRTALDEVFAETGGLEGYLDRIGFTVADRADLHAALVEPHPDGAEA